MIEIKKINVYNMEQAIYGMRNPLNSWGKSDSCYMDGKWELGLKDLELAKRLIKSGKDHRKFLRQIFVNMEITAPLYFFNDYEQYKVGTVDVSTSTMHKIAADPFLESHFSTDQLCDEAKEMFQNLFVGLEYLRWKYNTTKDKKYWYSIIQLLPRGHHYTRMCTLNYEVAYNIYEARKDHKLDEWRILCDTFVKELPFFNEFFCKEIIAQEE